MRPGDPKKSPLRDIRGSIIRGKDAGDKARRVWFDTQALTNAGRVGADNPVKTILEKYLADAEKRVAPKTLKSYTDWYQSFSKHWTDLQIRELKPQHLKDWWEAHPSWGQTVQNMSGAAIKAAFKWAAAAGGGALIPSNPLDGFKLPTAKKRNAVVVVTPEEFAGLLALVQSQ